MIGYNYFKHKGYFWRKHQGAIIPLTMPHVEIKLSEKEAREMIKEHKAFFVRWDTDFDLKKEGEWWHIIKDGEEDIDSYNSKMRSQIRRGGRHYDVRVCSREVILLKGHQVYCEAYKRYHTFEEEYSKEKFNQAIKELPEDTEFWGAYDKRNNELIAFSENFVSDNACFYLTMWLTPESLKNYSSYILFHEMNKHYLNDRKMHYVSDGARSISHDTNIHEFLISKFAFRKAYCNLHVIYHPIIGFFVKLLYPFRTLFKSSKISIFQKISVLLSQHEILNS